MRDERPFVVQVAAYFVPTPTGYSYQLLNVTETPPPTEVAEALNLAAHGTAILRKRLTLHDGDPVDLHWSYYPAEIAARSPLAERTKIPGGAPQVLATLATRNGTSAIASRRDCPPPPRNSRPWNYPMTCP
ncbi:MAG: UTRA domain-containing protein [Pseudonocardiaceae bacterium]